MKDFTVRLSRFFERRIVFVPLLISALFILYLGSITKGHTLFVHDSSLYLTRSEALAHFGGLWKSDSFGYTDYLVQAVSFFSNLLSASTLILGMPFFYSQLLIFFVILLLVWYGSWYAFKKAFDLLKLPETLYSSFFASVLYTFNLYMIASWHGGTIVALFVVFALAPTLFFLLVDFLCGGQSMRKKVALALCIGIAFSTAPYAVAVIIALFFPFFMIQRKQYVLGNIKNVFISGVLSLFIAAFFIALLSLSYLYSDPYPIKDNLTSYAFSDFGIQGVFRFFFEWTIDKSWGGRYFHSYYPYYNQWFVIISAFVLWLISFVTLLKLFSSSQDSKQKVILIFSFLIALLGVFISKANQAPFGDLNMFLYEHVPLFNMFRTPDTKFGLSVMLSLSFLVGYFLATSKGFVLRSVVVIVIVLQILPFFSAVPIVEVKAGDEYQRVFDIPQAYRGVKQIVDSDNKEGYILFFPGTGYANFDYKNGTGLNGQDMLGKMIDRPIVYSDNFIFGKSKYIYNLLEKNPQSSSFNEYGIRYVFVRKDIVPSDIEMFSEAIAQNDRLEKIYTSDLGDLYRIKDSLSSPLMIIQSSIASVEYDFRNDSSVQPLTIRNLTEKTELSFLQSFHPGWKIYADNENCQFCLLWTKQLPGDTHHLVKDYANGWTIDPEYIKANFPKDSYHENPDGSIDVNLTLFFKPQIYFSLGLIVSGLTLVGCLGYLMHGHRVGINFKPSFINDK